ncbi:MAG: hypothetical protein JW934_09950 [Anaerolineae bacterium]|nr:hypothetical protein [Anaerolineae bacterium]
MIWVNKRWVIALFGVLTLGVGILGAFFGPVELYCFYLFEEGGPFHYPGFGFGSFMFGNIATQIIGYYVIAALFIPLGYGHFVGRRWARTLALTLLWSWIVVGVPLSIVFLFVLLTAKDLSLAWALVALALTVSGYLILPWLLIRFYDSRGVRAAFEVRDPNSGRLDQCPLPILVLSFLYTLYIVCLHVPLFFRGIFPFFGTFLFDLDGILGLTLSMFVLALLVWGTLRRRHWAWWGALIYLGLSIVSISITLVGMDYPDLLDRLAFPPAEVDVLRGLPVQGLYLVPLIGLPLAMTLGAVVLARKHFDFKRVRHAERPPNTEPVRQ